MTLEQFINDVARKKAVFIYGAGARGKLLASLIASKTETVVDGFIVSNGHKVYNNTQMPGRELKIPIYEYAEIEERVRLHDLSSFLICNSANDSAQVMPMINRLVENSIDSEAIDILARENLFLEEACMYDYLGALGVQLNAETLFFKDVKCFNPLMLDKRNITAMFATLADELLPSIYDEASLCFDGPFETDNVFISSDDVVIDAGATFGMFSCYAAHKGCRVFSFEPDERNLDVLRRQAAYYPHGITVVDKCLSDTDGIATMSISEDRLATSISALTDHSLNTAKIQTVCLDNMYERGEIDRVDYIKADIEGAERLMLKGAENILRTFSPKLALCTYHIEDDAKVLTEIIKNANPAYRFEYGPRKMYAWADCVNSQGCA